VGFEPTSPYGRQFPSSPRFVASRSVLVPLSLTSEAGETVIVRLIRSQRAMTAIPVQLPARM